MGKSSTAEKPKYGRREGPNTTFYLDRTYRTKKARNAVVEKAREIAVRRRDTCIRIEYVFLAEGKLTPRQLGSTQARQLKAKVQNERLPRKRANSTGKRQTAAPRPRRQRAKATASK